MKHAHYCVINHDYSFGFYHEVDKIIAAVEVGDRMIESFNFYTRMMLIFKIRTANQGFKICFT